MVTSASIPRLFTPLKVGDITLQHRVVMAPLTRFRANDEHIPQDKIAAEYYSQRASLGTLLISEATPISAAAGGYPNIPGIYTDDQIAGWKHVTDAVHAKGGFIYLQMWAIGRAAMKTILAKDGFEVVSASDIPISEDKAVPRALTKEEILEYVQRYAQAAKNAVEKAGFDGVEIHSANGYHQFLQSNSNKRNDEFGGSVENRSRFSLLVVRAVTDAIGQEKTGIRLSPYGTFQGMRMPPGLLEEQFTHIISTIAEEFPRLAYLHIIEPSVEADSAVDPDSDAGGANIDWARKAWGEREASPFFSAGGYTRERALETAEKYGGGVVFGRLFLANPDLPLRLRHNVKLNDYDRSTFYSQGPKGYTDYQFSSELPN
ncbi:hypothetical protein FRB96_000664 [Tulasnella sp. 330]|nr:hypothetical protein FRB96_000664 [Tulasnella sp. 330]